MSKTALKSRFFTERLKLKLNNAKIKRNSRYTLISGWGEFFQSEKTDVQVSAVPKLTVSL